MQTISNFITRIGYSTAFWHALAVIGFGVFVFMCGAIAENRFGMVS